MKRIGRLKRKTGAVLFAVVCVMALLIAMATTAYYTARSAYNSVVSNYNYSQLYLSAISVADMVTEAVINDSIPAATGSGQNDYAQLRNAILGMTTVGSKVHARSSNIPAADVGNDAAIVSTLQSEQSIIAGVLDGVVVEAEVTGLTVSIVPNDKTIGGKDCDKYVYDLEYTFTTTAYYRNNSITVEDIVKVEKNEWYDVADRTTNKIPNTNVKDPDPPDFNTFLTATGQGLSLDADGKAQPSFPSRIVKIMTKEVSDDAFFQNDKTYFFDVSAGNNFKGGLTSTGDVFLEQFTSGLGTKDPTKAETYDDWFIGGDLALTKNANLDLKNNNLYVKGDLIIDNDRIITAENIYVEGNVYILGSATTKINGNLHVTKDIKYDMDKTAGSNTAISDAAAEDFYFSDYWSADKTIGNLEISGTVNVAGNVVIPDGWTDSAQITVVVDGEEKSDTFATTSSAASSAYINTYDSSQIKDLQVASRGEDANSDKYTADIDKLPLISYQETNDDGETETVSGVFDTKVGSQQKYSNYTAKNTYSEANKATIDFSKVQAVYEDDGTTLSHYEYTDPSTGIKITTEGTSDATNLGTATYTVDIPYRASGYFLDIQSNLNGDCDFVYNIGASSTKDANGNYTTMPIVLKDNITTKVDDGNGNMTDAPGFSWAGKNLNQSSTVEVLIAPTNSDGSIKKNADGTTDYGKTDQHGNVIFEMASYDTATKTYGPYNADNYAKTGSVVYVAGEQEFVGTKAQLDKIGVDGRFDETTKNEMLDENSVPRTGYDNKFMLVSNANNATSMDVSNINNIFCGYVYAPNGKMYGDATNACSDGDRYPVLGGMIVSNYDVDKSYVYYSEPKPSMIANTIGALNKWGVGNDNSDNEIRYTITETEIPGGTLMDTNSAWELRGSNYVG